MVMPHLVHEGQKAMQTGSLGEARKFFATYLLDHDEGVFADGAKWVVAWLPDVSDEPGKIFFKQIERLQAMKAEQPDSVYAPWALCSMGQLYWDAGWHSEANALFEEFLGSYPEHPLAGGVMVEAGLGYLENQQFLEAALVLRRVVEEPKWEAHRLRGALGLADATAMAKAWRQANYWYRVVEAERPELIRQSERSSYYYGLTELAVGDSRKAIPRFLTTVNMHPQQEIAGHALNRISEKLLKEGHGFLSLWFSEQAKRRFKGKESGRRGQAAQTRWVVEFLSQDRSKEEWVKVYQRLDDLEIYLSVSWDNVVETARILSQAPEQDLVEESTFWMGQGYLTLKDIPAAIQSFMHLAIVATSETWRQEAQQRLSAILNQQIQTFYDQQAWVPLLKFHEEQQDAFHLVPLTRERVKTVAQAYQHVNLPAKAMQWYEQLLQDHPESPLREEIFAQKVFLAEDQGKGQLVQDAGEMYLREYPQGQWRAEVSTALGMESVGRQDYPQAIQQLSDVLTHTHEMALQRYVLRNRALAYQEAGKRDLALLDLQQVVALDPLDMANVVRLGDFLFDQGDFADAEPLYDQVLSSEAPVALKAWAKFRWGLSLDYQGKATESQKLLAEVRQLETQSSEFENTIRAAAVAVLDEFSMKEKPQVRRVNEGT
jgi:tetratricopeptide (TPR) repeat protein